MRSPASRELATDDTGLGDPARHAARKPPGHRGVPPDTPDLREEWVERLPPRETLKRSSLDVLITCQEGRRRKGGVLRKKRRTRAVTKKQGGG